MSCFTFAIADIPFCYIINDICLRCFHAEDICGDFLRDAAPELHFLGGESHKEVLKEFLLEFLGFQGNVPAGVVEHQMHRAAVGGAFPAAEESLLLQGTYGKGDVGFGEAPAFDDVHGSVQLRIVEQKEENVHLVAGQAVAGADRLHNPGVFLLGLLDALKVAGDHLRFHLLMVRF